MTSPLNLASRPFRNERLPTLLVALGTVALAAVTVEHARTLKDLLPGGSSGLHQELAALQQEQTRLRAERRELRAPVPERGTLTRWSLLRDLVDRRTLSWTALLSVLEEVIPPDVRLVSISPETTGSEFLLDVIAIARSKQAALSFVRLLEQRAEFAEIYPASLSEVADGTELRCSMRYRPRETSASEPKEPGSEDEAVEPRPDAAPALPASPAENGAAP